MRSRTVSLRKQGVGTFRGRPLERVNRSITWRHSSLQRWIFPIVQGARVLKFSSVRSRVQLRSPSKLPSG